MLERRAHFWICCLPGELEKHRARLLGPPIRVKLANQPTSKFGPYDYLFIDSPKQDEPIDFVVESLLDLLEPHASYIQPMDPLLSGIEVIVRTSDARYLEAMDSSTFGRIARLKLQVTFNFQHASEPSVAPAGSGSPSP